MTGGIRVGRGQVAGLMRAHRMCGVIRGAHRAIIAGERRAGRAEDLVDRDFTATAANRLWVADVTYAAHQDRVHLPGVHPGRLLADDRRLADRLGSRQPGDRRPPQMAIGLREPAPGLTCHTDTGSRHVSTAYTERVAAAGMRPWIGTRRGRLGL